MAFGLFSELKWSASGVGLQATCFDMGSLIVVCAGRIAGLFSSSEARCLSRFVDVESGATASEVSVTTKCRARFLHALRLVVEYGGAA